MITIKDYERKKDYLICVDSDGCAMDTMNVKHFKCFGPCMIGIWGLDEWRDDILKRWNDINLFTMTRGVNRFRGLAMILEEIDGKYKRIPDLSDLLAWADCSPELSNRALERAIEEKPESRSLGSALEWSNAVNKAITELPEEEILPFPLAREALETAHCVADVAIVSSANLGAVLDEWERHSLLPHTDIVLAQDAGSKAACIAMLLEKGYSPDCVLMCGDAPGDLKAAEKNGVHFFPILVGREKESWEELMNNGINMLLSGDYGKEYGEERRKEFLDNLRK